MTNHLQSLINAVDAADSAQKLLEAVQDLAAIADMGAIPTLIKALGYNNPGAAVAAVDGLIQIGEPAVPSLLELLDGYNYTARAWTIRALAGIGDPRGLMTLLGAATADFSLSVRRAAARGLGTMKWHWFPADLLEIAQEEVLEALIFVCEDTEWVVRYAAVTGLQALASAVPASRTDWLQQIEAKFDQILATDESWAVRARVQLARQQLKTGQTMIPAIDEVPSSLSDSDWQSILDKLYARKSHEREVLPEGDPRRFRGVAATLLPKDSTNSAKS
jgi:phycocyanobilin lyase subunit beta